jgi:ketosteroid isomerase-like protein
MTVVDPHLDAQVRLRIEHELIQLNNAFAYDIDHGEFDALVDLFTEDGVFDRAGPVHRGRAELREAMQARPNVTTRHLVTNVHFLSVGPDEAEGTATFLTFHGHGELGDEPLVYGTAQGRLLELRDTYRRTDEGWKFATRIATPIFVPEVWP